MEDDFNLYQMEVDLNLYQMEDDLNILANGRRPHLVNGRQPK